LKDETLSFFIVIAVFISGCSKNTSQVSSSKSNVISETKRQRDLCQHCYVYRIETAKAILDLNLKPDKESDPMVYFDFFNNIADTNLLYKALY